MTQRRFSRLQKEYLRMHARNQEKILFVDDEERLLSALKRNLRRSFEIEVAISGKEGLSCIQQKGPFAVVVSDMQMPEMNGAEFLGRVRTASPDSIRIMLTGDAGQDTAVSAINKADVFKFVNKPCDLKTLQTVLQSAINEYSRRQAENTILEKTVQGSIGIVTELLGLSMPEVFGRSNSIKTLATGIANKLEYKSQWQLGTACLMAHIGCMGMSPELTRKLCHRVKLNEEELAEYSKALESSADMIRQIPRLEGVADIVRQMLVYADNSGPVESPAPEDIPVDSKIIRLAMDLDEGFGLEEPGDLIAELEQRRHCYDAVVLEAGIAYLEDKVQTSETEPEVEMVDVRKLTDNMELAEDIVDKFGVLLVCSGWQTTENVRKHLQKCASVGTIEREIAIKHIVVSEEPE